MYFSYTSWSAAVLNVKVDKSFCLKYKILHQHLKDGRLIWQTDISLARTKYWVNDTDFP